VSRPRWAADYAQAVRRRQAWAAIEDGQVAGFAVLIARPGYLLLDNVAVLPAAQDRGIGARLLGLAEDHARRLGLSEIHLYTNEAMTKNLAYYARHGYVETHRAQQSGFHRVFFRNPSTNHPNCRSGPSGARWACITMQAVGRSERALLY
jgi:N-acetylglutamate synthase-like GNAT family acetyltransferase